jgi:ATP/maltotriose-dependent transcriptional regulator MalT/DNA-binding SARP family transcriptional activator
VDRNLWLICGQPAQGKTTLISGWVEDSGIDTAWLDLESGASSPDNLLYCLAAALGRFSGEPPEAILALLGAGGAPFFSEGRLARAVQLLYQVMPSGTQLVLDGLDRLPDDSPGMGLVGILARSVPEDRRLILLSRHVPAGLEPALEAGGAFRLDNAELACTPSEVAEMIGRVGRADPPPELAAKVHRLTEGWVGGVVLFSQLLPGLSHSQQAALVRLKGELFQYLARNVFGSLEPDVQDFLVDCAPFRTLEPRLLARLSGRRDAGEILDSLCRRNLFLGQVRGEDGRRAYRVHALLHRFLEARHRERHGPERRRGQLARAGRLLVESRRWEAALPFLLEAQDFPSAAACLRRVAPRLSATGRLPELERRLSDLPPEHRRGDPWLLYYWCLARRWQGLEEIQEALPRLRQGFAAAGDQRGLLVAQALALDTVMAGQPWSVLDAALREAERLLESVSPEKHLAERAELLTNYGFIQSLRGSPRKGVWALEQALAIAHRVQDPAAATRVFLYQMDAYNLMGLPKQAENTCRHLERLLRDSPLPEEPVELFIPRACLHLLRGEIDEAQRELQLSRERIERDGLHFLLPVQMLYELMVASRSAGLETVRELESRYRALPAGMVPPFARGAARLLLGLGEARLGEARETLRLAEESLELLSKDEGWSLVHWSAGVLLKMLSGRRLGRDPEELARELAEAHRLIREMGSLQFQCECELLLALLCLDRGGKEEAERRLAGAAATIRAQGYSFPLFLPPQELAELVAAGVELGRSEDAEALGQMLVPRGEPGYPEQAESLLAHPRPEVRALASRLKARDRRSRAPELMVTALGRFRVLVDGQEVEGRRWGRKQARLLLMAIVALGPRGVAKEQLLEALWPEAEPKSARQSFRVTLHRLRKALEPELDPDAGSSYLLVDNDELRLAPGLVRIDLEEFRVLVREAERLQAQGDPAGELERLGRAAALYQDDFLADEPYADWAQAPRRRLRKEFLDLLMRLGRLQERRGRIAQALETYQRAIQADPVLEPAYQRLMTLQAELGLLGEAKRTYRACCEALRRFQDADPGWNTRALYQNLKASE